MAITLNGTTGISGVDGSAGTPAVQGADSNTGVFFPAADTIAFAEGGTEVARFDSSGNFGLGTTSPSGASGRVLEVYGGAGQARLVLKNDATGSSSSDGSQIALVGSQLVIQNREASEITFEANGNERMRIDSSGNLLVGTTSSTFSVSPSSTGLQVKSTGQIWPSTAYASQDNIVCATTGSVSGTHTYLSFYAGGVSRGSINFDGSTFRYSTSSDYRLKENVQPMQDALDTISQLNPVTYTWKSNGSDGQGFIAHELQAVVPDCVVGEKDAVDDEGNPKYQGIDTSFLVATLVKAVQELTARITALEAAQ